MKTLVVYYSRTGTTKKIGEEIAKKLRADVEEIRDTVDRKGVWGWLISGRDAMKRRLTKLHRPSKNPANYELVIIGTPVWAGNVSVPVRTYLAAFKDKFKKVAFFCTLGSKGDKRTFSEMEKVIAAEPVATLAIATKETAVNTYSEKLENYIALLN